MIRNIFGFLLILFVTRDSMGQSAPSSTYTGKPMFQILTKRNNAVLGTTIVELFPNIAPKATRNFDSLVRALNFTIQRLSTG